MKTVLHRGKQNSTNVYLVVIIVAKNWSNRETDNLRGIVDHLAVFDVTPSEFNHLSDEEQRRSRMSVSFYLRVQKNYYYDADAIREPHVTFIEQSRMKGGRKNLGKRDGTPENGKNKGNPNFSESRFWRGRQECRPYSAIVTFVYNTVL